MTSEQSEGESEAGPRRFPLWLFMSILLIGIAAPFVYAIGTRVYAQFVEISAPTIEILAAPAGVGIAPVALKFRVSDGDSGLDEVIVRAGQRGRMRELFKRKMKGVKSFEEEIPFAGSKSTLQEGTVDLEIVAFDKAFWSNRGEKTLQLRVDYRKPKVEVLTTQHNARRGGSQLVFYRAFDEEVAATGVRIGDKVFLGYRASALDPLFTDANLYAAFYAIDIGKNIEPHMVQVFASDHAGNEVSTDFYNKILDRPIRSATVALSEEFLRGPSAKVFDQQSAKVLGRYDEYRKDAMLATMDPLALQFKALNDVLRAKNQSDIGARLAAASRFESFFKQFFLKQNGITKAQFGEQITFTYNNQPLGSTISTGYELAMPSNQDAVVAVNDGIVVMAENCGTYGYCVGIDHGLGISSLYAQLGAMQVHEGDTVKRGDTIASAGTSGLALRSGALLEMRVHGVPVDPLEWWDASWFNQHIVAKMDEIKSALGITVYKPL